MTAPSFIHYIVRNLKYLCLVLVLIPGGCIDEIAIDNQGVSGRQMVIQGQLLKGNPSVVRVTVSRTADFVARSLPEPVSQAQVTLLGQADQQVSLIEITPGSYQWEIPDQDSSMSIQPGITYQISVHTSEGNVYESSPETMEEVPQPDSISISYLEKEALDDFQQRVTKGFLQFSISTPLVTANTGNSAYIRWLFDGIYRFDEKPLPPDGLPGPGPATCFVQQNLALGEVVVFNGNEAAQPRLSRFLLTEEEVDSRFAAGYLLTIRQQSLSRSAFEYWEKVGRAIALSGGLFQATPGRISGNISNRLDPEEEVLGYFYVSNERIVKRFISPEEAGKPQALCNDSFNADTQPCNNCLSIANSTRNVPQDWGQ